MRLFVHLQEAVLDVEEHPSVYFCGGCCRSVCIMERQSEGSVIISDVDLNLPVDAYEIDGTRRRGDSDLVDDACIGRMQVSLSCGRFDHASALRRT